MDEQPLWDCADVARYLRLKNVNSIGNMVREGRITSADGMVKVGRLTRFHRHVVLERVAAGLFGRGLEGDCAAPVPQRRLRTVGG
jgi:hypothetical protein